MDINFIKNSKGLFVFSDPGGAKPILSFIINNKLSNYKIFSDRKYEFYSDFNLDVNFFNDFSIEKLLLDYKPDYLFTGTSYTSKIEVKFLKFSEKINIKTYSYIDHYTNYEGRFNFKNKIYLPDNLLLIDNKAKRIALKTKLSTVSNIHVCSNFYHEFLKNWKPKTERSKLIDGLCIDENKSIVVLAPDPISNINGKKKYNYDEYDVSDDLLSSLENIDQDNFILIIKTHPNQDTQFKNYLIKKYKKKNMYFYQENSCIDLLFHLDIIVGMFSSILIEANLFSKKIIRHIPSDKMDDPIRHLNIGEVSKSQNELKKILTKIL